MSALQPNGVTKPAPLQRPPLPHNHANPNIASLDANKLPPVKFQEIVRQDQATIVARIKIPTPGGHAFVLRRLDTDAISLTTMFRTAFPTASEEMERREAAWVKAVYDTTSAHKSGKVRFAGTWVTPDVARIIAKDYGLQAIIQPLVDAVPDPNVVYRKLNREGQQQTPATPPVPTPQATAQSTPREAHPAKRRRETSPAASPAAATASAVATPARRAKTPQSTTVISPPGSRRSARIRSPAPPATPATVTSPKTPKTAKAVHEHLVSVHVGSDVTVVEEEDAEVVKVSRPTMEEDLQEQKELIERLKAERDAALSSSATLVDTAAPKRAREDEESTELKLNIKEPENEERALVTNSRVRGLRQMPPERKSLAWGALAFAIGMGAVQFLPSIPSFF